MTAVLIAILTMTVAGLPLTIALDRSARGPLLLGLAFLYGSGAATFALLALSIVHIRWTAVSAMSALLFIAIAAALFVAKREGHIEGRGPRAEGRDNHDLDPRPSALGPRPSFRPSPFKPHVLDILTVVLLLAYTAYITVANAWEWDFWAIWGLKARVFLEHGGIDWAWLGGRWNEFAHPDYPPLVPLNYDFACLLGGGWSDRWLALILVAWAAAALLVIRALAAAEAPPWVAASATAASAVVVMSRYAGMAEAALIAFASTGLLFLRKAMHAGPDDAGLKSGVHGALLLGLAANCKNEGIALLATTAIAIVVTDVRQWRRVLRLWPSLMLLAPWMLLRMTHVLPTDIVSGNIIGRFVERATRAGEVFSILGRALVDPWSWLLIILTFAIVPMALRRERFIVVVTFLQIAVYVVAYFITPHDVTWHIMTSWQRLSRHVQVPITVVCVLLLAQLAMRGEDAPHAEARPGQP